MIDQRLHRQVVPVDRDRHRPLRLRLPVTDWSVASRLNAAFLAAAEFGDACRDYPIVFVRTGRSPEGKADIAPLAVFGVEQERNLYLDGGRWRAAYLPALLRTYPFCIGRLDEQRYAVCIDLAWPGIAEGEQAEGQALFTAEGQPTPLLTEAQQQLERFEAEVARTRAACQRLEELGLLRDMRFDATLPDGRKHSVDGFLTVDEKRLAELPDETVVELHRNGLLGMVHAHWISLGHMRKLMDWHLQSAAG